MIQEIRVENWSELHNVLFADSWLDGIARFRSPFAFRGLSNEAYTLQTALLRLGHEDPKVVERHLLRNFQKYAHRSVVERESFWHWLSIAQHHGLPTRLMDWTYSPLVALHFATAEISKFRCDGVVWAVDFRRAHSVLPEPLRAALTEVGADVFSVDMLARFERTLTRTVDAGSFGRFETTVGKETIQVNSLNDFDALSTNPFLLFFEPPSIDDRIVNQFALFSVMSNVKLTVDHLVAQAGFVCKKVIIPANLKWEVRDKLDQANITERVLFPGLDGLSSWLRRHYSPSPRAT